MQTSIYNSLNEWAKTEPNACAAAYRAGLIHSVCNMFGWKIPDSKKYSWPLELCKKEAFKYKTRGEWKKMIVLHILLRLKEVG